MTKPHAEPGLLCDWVDAFARQRDWHLALSTEHRSVAERWRSKAAGTVQAVSLEGPSFDRSFFEACVGRTPRVRKIRLRDVGPESSGEVVRWVESLPPDQLTSLDLELRCPGLPLANLKRCSVLRLRYANWTTADYEQLLSSTLPDLESLCLDYTAGECHPDVYARLGPWLERQPQLSAWYIGDVKNPASSERHEALWSGR